MKVKIDTSNIPNYESMSAEDKIKALTEYEVETPDADYSGWVKKDVFDKKASEAANLSKQLKSKMSDSEIAEQENQKRLSDMQNELDALKKEKTVSQYKAQYLGLGYEDADAQESALALANGDMEKVFSIQKSVIDKQHKETTAKALNLQPDLTEGKNLSNTDLQKAEENKWKGYFGL